MEPDAAATVLKGALTTCLAGGAFGATYGVVKRHPPLLPAFTASVNSGLAGLTFFAFREYLVGPILVETIPWKPYIRRREVVGATAASLPIPASTGYTYADTRTHKLLDTAIAGSATGGILSLFKRGVPNVVPSAVTVGLICTAAQFLWNELEVTRIKVVSRARRRHPEAALETTRSRTFSEKFMDSLGVILPVRKLSDEEYLQKLVKQREEVENRLEEVRTELEKTVEREKTR